MCVSSLGISVFFSNHNGAHGIRPLLEMLSEKRKLWLGVGVTLGWHFLKKYNWKSFSCSFCFLFNRKSTGKTETSWALSLSFLCFVRAFLSVPPPVPGLLFVQSSFHFEPPTRPDNSCLALIGWNRRWGWSNVPCCAIFLSALNGLLSLSRASKTHGAESYCHTEKTTKKKKHTHTPPVPSGLIYSF